MIPLFKRLFHEFWWHEDKARLWLRSGLGFTFGVLAQVYAYPWSVVRTWSLAEMAGRFVIACIPAFAGGIGYGERNKPEPKP